jgi:hypothetical protein
MKIFVTDRYIKRENNTKLAIISGAVKNWELTENYIECDVALFFDNLIDSKNFKQNPKCKNYLIRSEPPMVLPSLYKKGNLANFVKIISVGSDPLKYKNTVFGPQILKAKIDKNNKRHEKRIAIINSDLLSLYKGELYSLRRKVSTKIPNIDLYGRGWNKNLVNKFKTLLLEVLKFLKMPMKLRISGLRFYFRKSFNYLGEVEDKNTVLSRYKYSIVIENSLNYVSEKIFDSLVAGCIPIYIGPPVSNFGIPKEFVIECKPNIESIREGLDMARALNYLEWQQNLKLWINDKKTISSWDESTYLLRINNLVG